MGLELQGAYSQSNGDHRRREGYLEAEYKRHGEYAHEYLPALFGVEEQRPG